MDTRLNVISFELLDDTKVFCYCEDHDIADIAQYLESSGYNCTRHQLRKVTKNDAKDILDYEIKYYLGYKDRLSKGLKQYYRDMDKLEKDKKRLEDEIEKFHSKKMKFIKERDSHKSDSDSEEEPKKVTKKKK